MKSAIIQLARIGLGLAFLIFGIDGLLLILKLPSFLPMPPRVPAMMEAMNTFYNMHYFMPLVKIIETSTAIMLLTNRYVKLAIVLLSPIIVNVFLMRIFLDPHRLSFLFLTLLFVVADIILIYNHWSFFRKLFDKK